MAKKRKKTKNKTVRRYGLIVAFFLMSGRWLLGLVKLLCSAIGTLLLFSTQFILWLIKQLYRRVRANNLLAIGVLIFIISFGAISFNALFLQEKIYRSSSLQKK